MTDNRQAQEIPDRYQKEKITTRMVKYCNRPCREAIDETAEASLDDASLSNIKQFQPETNSLCKRVQPNLLKSN